MLAYPSIFSRLTTGLDFTTSVCELPSASSTFLTVNTVCADCIYTCCAARRHNLARFFLSAAQFLTVNSGRRFFYIFFSTGPLECCSVLRVNAPVQPRRPSTLTLVLIRRWTHHLIPPLTPHSPFVPATSCPDTNIDPQVDQAYFAPHPPRLPHGFNYHISKTSLLYRLSLICF